MVTLDNKVQNVPQFDGDLTRGEKNYQRAQQGLEVVKSRMGALEDTLKAETGYNDVDLPLEVMETTLEVGDVTFLVTSHTGKKRPQYKTAVVEMENYLAGIATMLGEGRTITGVVKQGRGTYVKASALLDQFDIMVAGVMRPGVTHKITYEAAGELADEPAVAELELPQERYAGNLNADNAANYVRMDRLNPNLVAFKKDYEKELAKGQRKPVQTTQVKASTAYTTTKAKAVGPNWAYVVKTMVTVPTDKNGEGELNELADPDGTKTSKRELPYQVIFRENRGGTEEAYVSIQSVYKRIEGLKEESQIKAKRLQAQSKEVV